VDRSAELRLPTVVVPVRLCLIGQEARGAELFVADVARRGRAHLLDDLAELLDASVGFVPARLDGAVRLLGAHAIAWIAVRRLDAAGTAAGAEPASAELPEELSDASALYDRQYRVSIELAHGPAMAGLLLDSSPADRTRVIDHLNRPGLFVRLWTPDEQVLVNKRQIVAVAELDPSDPLELPELPGEPG
jgi:hypothetical protein